MTTTAKPPMPPLQRGWLIVYWLAPPIVLMLLIQALATFTAERYVPIVALIFASISMGLGLTFATRLARLRPDDVIFLKGTTTVRVIAVAWLLISLAIPVGAIVSVLADIENLEMVDWSSGFTSTAGSLSILAIIGPGYAEYREAMKQAKSELEHAV